MQCFIVILLGLLVHSHADAPPLPFHACDQQFVGFNEAVFENFPRIVCPFFSTLIHERILPVKKWYTRAELMNTTIAAGVDADTVSGHVQDNFRFIPAALIDLFNMEGNPNEHNVSTGVNDCHTFYTQESPGPVATNVLYNRPGQPFCDTMVDDLPKCLKTDQCPIPSAARFDVFWNTFNLPSNGNVTLHELEESLKIYLDPAEEPQSTDDHSAGAVLLAEAMGLAIGIFGQGGTMIGNHVHMDRASFRRWLVDRRFPTYYTFPNRRIFVDANPALNDNEYRTPQGVTSAWSLNVDQTKFNNWGDSANRCLDKSGVRSEFARGIFFGYNTAGAGSISAVLKGSGDVFLDYGNCGRHGTVRVLLGGQEIDRITNPCDELTRSKVIFFQYTHNQELKLEEMADGDPIIRLNLIAVNGTAGTATGSPCATQRWAPIQAITEGANGSWVKFGVVGLLACFALVTLLRMAKKVKQSNEQSTFLPVAREFSNGESAE